MKGSFQPTRSGFSGASNAGLRGSASTAVRRSQDRGSTTSRQLSHTVKAAAQQREDYEPFGLELSKDADMVQWLQQQLSHQQGPLRHSSVGAASRPARKGWRVEPLAASTPPQAAADVQVQGPLLKAKTLPMVQLAVGGWKRGSKFEGDLVLKCYFTKKKLCWEILDGNLTYKCEMRWPEIQYLRSSQKDDVEVLELDVRQPPSFFEELDPQPKKRAVWKACQDFTGGQVSMGKRQHFYFLPGKLHMILPDFFALNQHLRQDHERVENPHSAPSGSESESAGTPQQPVTKVIETAYTEQQFLKMLSLGEYAYPSEGLPAELTGNVPSSSQSASSNFFPNHAASVADQEQTSSLAAVDRPMLEESFSFLGEPNPAQDSLDFDLPTLPPGIPAESFLDLMRLDSPSEDLGLPAEIAASLSFMPQQQHSASEDSSIIEEMMDWDGLCGSP